MARQTAEDRQDARMKAMVENMIKQSTRPQTEQERITADILARLTELGGQTVGEDSLKFQGSQIILPANMEGKLEEVVSFITDWDEQQNNTFEFSRKFSYRPWDGAAAFDRAMKRVFGTSGIGRATVTFFGVQPPELRTIPVGPRGQTLQVPWGRVEFSMLNATFNLGGTMDSEFGVVFNVSVEAPRKHRKAIEGFFKVLEDELHTGSIYKGKAITANPDEPQFMDLSWLTPDKVIYLPDVLTQLDVNVWSPIKYTAAMRENGIPLKRAVLLEGPNGTGKTLAGDLTAQHCEANGWTFILVRSGEDQFTALQTARMYAPAVVFIEDLDTIASVDKDRDHLSRVLDALDNAQSKGGEVMAVFTTNFPEKLDKGAIRAGRIDAVIHVGVLDGPRYEQLIRAVIPQNLLDKSVEFDKVVAEFDGFLPAFATEAAQRAVRYSIARNMGTPDTITTADLINAAKSEADHIRLMDEAQHGGTRDMNALENALGAVLARELDRTRGKFDGGPLDGLEIALSADGK